MANGIRTSDPHGFNKGCNSKFRLGSRVRQTPEEGQRTYRLKRCRNNNKDEDNSAKTLNDKNHQASSKKFRQLRSRIASTGTANLGKKYWLIWVKKEYYVSFGEI